MHVGAAYVRLRVSLLSRVLIFTQASGYILTKLKPSVLGSAVGSEGVM
jgi:hypothetical protein